MEPLNVTNAGSGEPVSIMSAHVVALTTSSRFPQFGLVLTTHGSFETKESRERLVEMWDSVKYRERSARR